MSKNKNTIETLQAEGTEIRTQRQQLDLRLHDINQEINKLRKEDLADKFTDLNLDDCNEDLRQKLVRELTEIMSNEEPSMSTTAAAFFFAWLKQSSPLVKDTYGSYDHEYTGKDDSYISIPHVEITGGGNYSADELAGIEDVIKKLQLVADQECVTLISDLKGGPRVSLQIDEESVTAEWSAIYNSRELFNREFDTLAEGFTHSYAVGTLPTPLY